MNSPDQDAGETAADDGGLSARGFVFVILAVLALAVIAVGVTVGSVVGSRPSQRQRVSGLQPAGRPSGACGASRQGWRAAARLHVRLPCGRRPDREARTSSYGAVMNRAAAGATRSRPQPCAPLPAARPTSRA